MRGPSKTPAPKTDLAERRTGKREAKVLEKGAMQIASFLYDFSKDGGAEGTYLGGTALPPNAIVDLVYLDAQEALVSDGTTTLQLKAGSTNLTDPLDSSTDFPGVTTSFANLPLKLSLTAYSELSVETAGDALTAGKVRFTVKYFVSA